MTLVSTTVLSQVVMLTLLYVCIRYLTPPPLIYSTPRVAPPPPYLNVICYQARAPFIRNIDSPSQRQLATMRY